jgi:TetR/AcrR family transcriptional regulator, transcriptional repressor for nem operon
MQVRTKPTETAELILDAAERRAQVLGFNGFSYADVAGELGITTASIHYHFPSKADLGVNLIERYTERFMAALAQTEADHEDVSERLRQYARLYEGALIGDRLCLCGMMAAEFETLADPIKTRLRQFFKRNEAWLAAQLQHGRSTQAMMLVGEPRAMAAAITSALEGAMLVARVRGGPAGFRATADLVLQGLCGAV